jgi:hypothetical protein
VWDDGTVEVELVTVGLHNRDDGTVEVELVTVGLHKLKS